MRRAKKQTGFSLIELMIGITVGLIILAGVVTVVTKTSFSGLENIRSVQLNQQLRNTMHIMHKELQRAGYVEAWTPGSSTVALGLDTAAIALFGTVTLGGTCATGVCDCILYSYDRDSDRVQGTSGTGFELFGFRLNNGVIQRRTSESPQSCGGSGWQPMTDPGVNVTALGFEQDAADAIVYEINGNVNGTCETGETCLARRKINISIDAELSSDSTITAELRDQVKIKNDHYYVAP